MSAIRAGYKAFTDPESLALDQSRADRANAYSLAWSYYRSTIFSKRNGDSWVTYLNDRSLYKHTRLIYNPVPQIVDFYVDNIWRPAANDKFESLVTPLRDSTDEPIIDAVAQLDQWSNFLAESQKIKRYAAATGNVLIEAFHDVARQKVLQKTVWPGYLSDFELNSSGDLQSYTLEYDVFDSQLKVTFKFKKVVTKESFSYYRDDSPFIPDGKSAEIEDNPYGFCPAILIRHSDDGGNYGASACKDFDKIDEINSLASHLHDNIHKTVESPVLISTKGLVKSIVGASNAGDSEALDLQDPRLNWMVLKTEEGASVLDLASKLKLAEAHPFLKDVLGSFHDDYPELQAAAIIKENSQLSGAALERMLGPAQNRLNGVQPFYNLQLVKLRQMQMAMAGFHLRGWSGINDQQRKFGDFNLNSYSDGKMEFGLKSSVLVQTTLAEDEELLKAKTDRIIQLSNLVDIGGLSSESIVGLLDEAELLPTDIDAKAELARIEGEETKQTEIRPVLNALQMPRQLGAGNNSEETQEETQNGNGAISNTIGLRAGNQARS